MRKGFGPPSKIAALHASLAKWEAIARGEASDGGIHDCPLCALYLKDSCNGCPVMESTGKPGCDNAPYELEWAPLVDADGVRTANTPEKAKAAESIIRHLREMIAERE